MTLAFAICCAVMTLFLFILLRWPQEEGRVSTWLLAALLPVLVAVTAAMYGQQAAARDLTQFDPTMRDRDIAWVDQQGVRNTATVPLNGIDAACVVHAAQRGGNYRLGSSVMYVPKGLELLGDWPTLQQVNALMIAGELPCRRLNSGEGQ